MDRIDDFDRFDYDANGNMVARNKGLSNQQTLVWNAENRLSEARNRDGNLIESYWYDVDGSRVKKVSGNTTTYTFFGHYEEEVTGGVTTAISHYSFGSLRVAVNRGGILFHLHGDHLGSTSLTTRGASTVARRAYYAYGAKRVISGDIRTDRTFTGQKADATGLMYYNARYYDPSLGTFISPDTIIPDPGMVIDYNRFLYTRGNPLKYTDPSGHDLVCVKGGHPGWNTGKDAFFEWCAQVAHAAGWDEKIHGPIHYINNDDPSTTAVAKEIQKSKAEDSSRPVVCLGHSWGGSGCLDTAQKLAASDTERDSDSDVEVDLVVAVDIVNILRSTTHTAEDGTIVLPENVDLAVGINASKATKKMRSHDGTPAKTIVVNEVKTYENKTYRANHDNVARGNAKTTIDIAKQPVLDALSGFPVPPPFRRPSLSPVRRVKPRTPYGGGAPVRRPLSESLHQFL